MNKILGFVRVYAWKKILLYVITAALLFHFLDLLFDYSVFLYHSIAELITIIASVLIIVITISVWKFIRDKTFVTIVALSMIFIAVIDIIHIFAFPGLNYFPNYYDGAIITSMWILARYAQAFALVAAILLEHYKVKLNYYIVVSIMLFITAAGILSIFYGVFPDSYIDGVGLSGFKVLSEYIIMLTFILCVFLIVKLRISSNTNETSMYIVFVVFQVFTEYFFTKYTLAEDYAFFLGHYFKILASIAFTYVLLRLTLVDPNMELFRKATKSEKDYKLLVDNSPISMVHYQILRDVELGTIEFRFLGINKVFEEKLGMRSSELVGKSIWSVFPNTEQYWIDFYEEVASSGKTIVFEDYSAVMDQYLKITAYKIDENKMAVIIEDITEVRKRQQEILSMSYHDSLTGLYNRRYYQENIVKLDTPENYPLTIVMSDINGLKMINDAFGHAAGDKLLLAASNVITKNCRENDFVARMGGDEFVIVMPNTFGTEAEKVIKKIYSDSQGINIESIELSIAFGIATKEDVNESIEDTFKSAEDLMYRTKLLELPSARSEAIEAILKTLHEKDKNSEIHSRVVSGISERLASSYGMDRQEINEVKIAGLLHDIGKIVIPISIITKKGKLTDEEYNLIKGHSEIGFRILNSTFDMRNISNIVLNHHERWDGLGYPRGIKSDEIPLQSRIIAIADAFDAMTSERTYRKTFTQEEALNEIIANAGTQFDPNLVKLFKEKFSLIVDFEDM